MNHGTPTEPELDEGGSHEAGPIEPASEPAPRRRGRGVLLAALALVLVAVLAAGLTLGPDIMRRLTVDDYDGPGTGQTTVVVDEGATGASIGATLVDAGVVASQEAFLQALEDNPGDEIQPGSYVLQQQLPAAEALSQMRSGSRAVDRVTIREGLWKAQVYEELSAATDNAVSDYQAVEQRSLAEPDLLGLPSSAEGAVEGYLYPATYEFDVQATPEDQMRQMVSLATAELRRQGVAEEDAQEVITIASLIEAEARLPEDLPKVSAVIHNRLRINMPLQLDSTVNYGVQNRAITTTDAERADDNPYNTYKHPGLPAGPINSPGAEAIEAARNPADGPWLYFVTVDPEAGTTVFSETKAEHDRAVLEFQRWCQARPGTC